MNLHKYIILIISIFIAYKNSYSQQLVADSTINQIINNKVRSTPSNATITIFLTNRTYKLTDNIFLNRPIKILGNKSVLEGNFVIYFKSDSIEINGCSLKMARIHSYSSNIKIVNNYFKNVKGNAITLNASNNNCSNILIKNNYFRNIQPLHDTLYNSSGRTIYAYSSNNNILAKIDVLNNEMNLIYGGATVFFSGRFEKINVAKNTIDSTSGQGIDFFNISSYSNGVVDNNRITNCGILRQGSSIKSGVGCNGIFASAPDNSGVIKINVTNNYIKNTLENGIEGDFYLIKNNYIENTGYDLTNFPTPSPEGIYGGFNIINNTIINPGGHGIYIFKDKANIIDRNISNNRISGKNIDNKFYGICLNTRNKENLTSNIKISNNVINNYGDKILFLPYNNNYKQIRIIKQTMPNSAKKKFVNQGVLLSN